MRLRSVWALPAASVIQTLPVVLAHLEAAKKLQAQITGPAP